MQMFTFSLVMFFDSSTESPMLFSSCNMPFSSESLHINPRALMLSFTNATFSPFFFRSTLVNLYLSTFLAPSSFMQQNRRLTLTRLRSSLGRLWRHPVSSVFQWQLWSKGNLEIQQKHLRPSMHLYDVARMDLCLQVHLPSSRWTLQPETMCKIDWLFSLHARLLR